MTMIIEKRTSAIMNVPLYGSVLDIRHRLFNLSEGRVNTSNVGLSGYLFWWWTGLFLVPIYRLTIEGPVGPGIEEAIRLALSRLGGRLLPGRSITTC